MIVDTSVAVSDSSASINLSTRRHSLTVHRGAPGLFLIHLAFLKLGSLYVSSIMGSIRVGNTHQHAHTDDHGRPWGTSPELTSVCSLPELVLSTNLAQGAFGTESLAYLIA